MKRQLGQSSPVHCEGIAKTTRKRAVACREVLVFRSQRAISRQSRERLAFGRRSLISLKSFLLNVCRGRTHYASPSGVSLSSAGALSVLYTHKLEPRVCHFHTHQSLCRRSDLRLSRAPALSDHPAMAFASRLTLLQSFQLAHVVTAALDREPNFVTDADDLSLPLVPFA